MFEVNEICMFCYIVDNLLFKKLLLLHLQIKLHWERHHLHKTSRLDLIRGILTDLENCLTSFVKILLGPNDLPMFSVLIISSISSGAVGL